MEALLALDARAMNEQVVQETLGVLLKYKDDVEFMQRDEVIQLLERLGAQERFHAAASL